MPTPKNNGRISGNFQTMSQSDLPNGRKGKHHKLIIQVLEDLEQLGDGRAIKVPLADFEGTVADIRSAVLRATKKKKLDISTSSDEAFFYLWKVPTVTNNNRK